jgi:D-alanyl-D-alanine dipeptidase
MGQLHRPAGGWIRGESDPRIAGVVQSPGEGARQRSFPRHYPNIDRADIVEHGYVATKSGHSRGSAIDLTLYDLANSALVPMGGDHDVMDSVSHHRARGITPAEARNRRALCCIMEGSGFNAFDCEWWHYSLRDEPYPDTYFDFPSRE